MVIYSDSTPAPETVMTRVPLISALEVMAFCKSLNFTNDKSTFPAIIASTQDTTDASVIVNAPE